MDFWSTYQSLSLVMWAGAICTDQYKRKWNQPIGVRLTLFLKHLAISRVNFHMVDYICNIFKTLGKCNPTGLSQIPEQCIALGDDKCFCLENSAKSIVQNFLLSKWCCFSHFSQHKIKSPYLTVVHYTTTVVLYILSNEPQVPTTTNYGHKSRV